MKGHIFFIMGISGSGKGTLINNLRLENNENFYFPLSNKTRKIRDKEVNHVDANFISREEFLSGIEKKEFLEYAVVYGKEYYGTKIKDIKDGLDQGKKVIKELDIIGLEQLMQSRKDFNNLYTTIFLDIPIEVLKERIYKRQPYMKNEELNRRIKSAIIEKEKAKNLCNYIIDTNKSEKEVLVEVLGIIKE